MDPSGSELDSSLPQPETPCLIVEDSQPDSIALEDDPESSYRALLTKRLSNLQPHSPSPVLEVISSPPRERLSQKESQNGGNHNNHSHEPDQSLEALENSPVLDVIPSGDNKMADMEDMESGADSTTCAQPEETSSPSTSRTPVEDAPIDDPIQDDSIEDHIEDDSIENPVEDSIDAPSDDHIDAPIDDGDPGVSSLDQGASGSADTADDQDISTADGATDADHEDDASPDKWKRNASEDTPTKKTPKKIRKYHDDYIAFGFTSLGEGPDVQPLCVICAKALSQHSMKPSLLRRHLETNHPDLKAKPRKYFERLLKGLSPGKPCKKEPEPVFDVENDMINETERVNKKKLESSYMVSYRVAKMGKPHTMVEDLILPAVADMVEAMLGEEAKGTIQTMPSSNSTISRRIGDMAGDILKQLILHIQASDFYSLQLDESTDVTGLAQLLVYVRYIHEGSIKEDMLFCKSIPKEATGEDIFRMLNTFVTSNGLYWSRCVGICTDGAKTMTGRHSAVVTSLQAVAPEATWVHCSIHREALATKGMPESLTSVLDAIVKIVNFVKGKAMHSHIFTALCSEMGSDHTNLLLYTEERWLSRGNVLTRVFELKDEFKMFFNDHKFRLSGKLHDAEFLTRLAYLGDIFSRLNELGLMNLGLQGLSATIFDVRDKIEAMIKKLTLWIHCMNSNNTEVFPSLHAFLWENNLWLTDGVKRDVTTHLSELAAQLRWYFPAIDESDNWIRYPFSAVPAILPPSEQAGLVDIASTASIKAEFKQKPLPDFWIGLRPEFPDLATRAIKKLMPFATTYLCECGFSALTSLRTKYRQRLGVEDNLRLRLSEFRPDIKELCAACQAHPSH